MIRIKIKPISWDNSQQTQTITINCIEDLEVFLRRPAIQHGPIERLLVQVDVDNIGGREFICCSRTLAKTCRRHILETIAWFHIHSHL